MDLYQFECPKSKVIEDSPSIQPDPARIVEIGQDDCQFVDNQERSRLSYADTARGEQQVVVDIDELPIPGSRGEYPTIRIPKKAYERGLDYCKQSLIGRIDVKDIDTEKFRQQAVAQWQSIGSVWMTPLGKGFIHIKFQSFNDYDKVWAGGPWKIGDCIIRLSKWQKNFKPDSQKLTNAPIWVKLPKLPLEFWDVESLMAIGRALGYPIKVDEATTKKKFGFYALVQVDMDLTKPIPEQILIEHDDGEFWQDVVVAKLPKFCKHCQMVGHWMSDCTRVAALGATRIPTQHPAQQPPQTVNLKRGEQGVVTTNVIARNANVATQGQKNGQNSKGKEIWQVVQPRNNNRNRRRNNNQQRSNADNATNRFDVLEIEEDSIRASTSKDNGAQALLDPRTVRPTESSKNIETEPSDGELASDIQLTPIAEVHSASGDACQNQGENKSDNQNVVALEHPVLEHINSPLSNGLLSAQRDEVRDSTNGQVSSQSADLGPVIIDPGDIGDPGETVPGLHNGQVAIENDEGDDEKSVERKKLLEESMSVSKMLLEQKQSWADLLDEEDDDRESRPSLSQPRRSGRSRSRSRMLEPYVSK